MTPAQKTDNADSVVACGFGAPFGIACRQPVPLEHAFIYLRFVGQIGRRTRLSRGAGGLSDGCGVVDGGVARASVKRGEALALVYTENNPDTVVNIICLVRNYCLTHNVCLVSSKSDVMYVPLSTLRTES